MASTSDALPERREPVLPRGDTGIGCAAMLEKDETAVRFQNSPHLPESLDGIRYGAQCPGRDDRIDACIPKRQSVLSGLQKEFDRKLARGRPRPRHSLKLNGRIYTVHLPHLRRIERQIQAGADTYFQ